MITACMSRRSWKVKVRKKKKKLTGRDDQSAISSKEHVKYEATQTHLFVSYVSTRPLALDRQTITATGSQQQQSTPPILLQRVFSGEKNNKKTMRYRDECMPLTGFFRGYCQLTMTFAWRSSTTQEKPLFFPCFWCRKCISCTLVHLPPCHKICHRQKACCV